jgi:C4-dicarboxylate transporter DctM subunit
VNLAIGQVTPPVGVNLFVASGLKLEGRPGVTVSQMSASVWKMIIACIIVLLLVTYIPQVSLLLIGG